MKIAIDISISTSAGRAFGNARGTLEFDVVPQIGDTISFAFPTSVSRFTPKGYPEIPPSHWHDPENAGTIICFHSVKRLVRN